MVNWIFTTAKVAVWTTRLNKLGEPVNLTNALDFFRRRLIGRINTVTSFLTTMFQFLKQSRLIERFLK